MASPYSVEIKGFQEIQEASRKLVYAMNPRGAMGQANRYTTLQMMRAVRVRAHKDTGTYAASIQAEFDGLHGRVYVGDNRNPKTGQSAAVYGKFEEARGGSHAAFAQASSGADAAAAAQDGIQIIIGALP
jgi:hypothetical protein